LEIEVQLAQKGRKDLVADQNEDLRDVRFFSDQNLHRSELSQIEVQLAQKGRKDLVADQNEDLRDVRFFSENLFLLVTMPKEIKRLHLVYIYIFHKFQVLIKEASMEKNH